MVTSQRNEPEVVEAPVASLTIKPPSDVPAAFNTNILSAKLIVVESTTVWVPCINKLPLTIVSPLNVTLTPLAVNASLNDAVYEFKLADVTFKVNTEVFTLAEVVSKLPNLPLADAVYVFKDADEMFNASILICWDAEDVFKAATELFKLAEVVSKLLNLPFADAVNEFNAVVDVFELV